MSLTSDLPRNDPKEDLFGHAPFAEQLAKSIARHAGEGGLVLALHGPWGSGKSTVLGYVRYYLKTQESTNDLVIVEFNPWWFAGRDDLARAFLRQLQAVLPVRSEKLRELGTLLGDFAEGIGGLIDLAGWTGGAAGPAGRGIGAIVGRQPKDVPALKSKIAAALKEAKLRVLVLVDDIDRLENSEVRQLFTVIKALADFPYVTYLLAFDHEVAARAVETDSNLPGARYLEKIIQVPFHLPAVDRVALRSAFWRRLDEVLAGTPEGTFDNSRWGWIYFGGLEPLIQVPRDIVRLANTLSVTYPGVIGEVNAVDFVAIEAIRVFLPRLYDTLRANPDKFAGHSPDRQDREAERAFHDKWVADVPEQWRASTRMLVERLFPKVSVMGYGTDFLAEWRRDRLVCHPDVFPVYFRFSLPSDAVGHAEIMSLVRSLANPNDFKERLLAAAKKTRVDGIPKARELLERLMDHVEKDVSEPLVPTAIEALLEVGDELVEPREQQGMFEPGSDSRVARPAYFLLKRVPKERRRDVVERAIKGARGLVISSKLVRYLTKEGPGIEPLLDADDLKHVQGVWIDRARALLHEPSVTNNPEFRWVLESWRAWGDPTELRDVCAKFVGSDAGLLVFLHAFRSDSQVATARSVKRHPRLNPAWLQPFVDTEAVATRLVALLDRGEVPEVLKVDVQQFLKERDMRAAGKDPDALGWPDDDE